MSHAHLRKAVAASLFGAALAMPAAALELFGPGCLAKLTERTRVWAECTHQFDRSDNRCKQPSAKMHAYMQKCASEGKSKAQVDAAMTEGYRLAGERSGGTTSGNPETPQPGTSSAATQNLLSKYVRESRGEE
jgi:hypothetical protein